MYAGSLALLAVFSLAVGCFRTALLGVRVVRNTWQSLARYLPPAITHGLCPDILWQLPESLTLLNFLEDGQST